MSPLSNAIHHYEAIKRRYNNNNNSRGFIHLEIIIFLSIE